MDNKLDTSSAVAAYLNDKTADTEVGVRHALSVGLGANPDYEAELRKVARDTGVPIDSVRAFPDETKRQAQMQAIQFRELTTQYPSTAAFLSGVENAKVAHDDIDNLSATEKVLGFFKRSGSALLSSVPAFNEGAWGVAQAGAEIGSQYVTGPLTGTILPEDPLARAADFFQQQRQASARTKTNLMPRADNIAESGFYSGLQSTGQSLLTIPLAILTGNPNYALAPMAGSVTGQAYGQARDQGLSVPEAANFGVSQGAVEYLTEKLPVGKLLGDLNAGTSFMRMLRNQAIAEVPGEQLATALQDLNEWAVLPENSSKTIKDYIEARPGAAAETLIATLVGVGGNVTVGKGIERAANAFGAKLNQAQQAEQGAATIDQLNQLAATSKLRARDADTFEQFIAQATADAPLQSVFIDAKTLMQSGVAEQLAQVSPAIAEQLSVALATGGDIAIPVAEYTARIAGTELGQPLLEHLKTGPGGMSRAEAQLFMQNQADELQAEVERVLSEKQADDTFKASAEVIKTNIKQQLDTAGRFTPDVNDAYSTLVSNFYAVTGARLGITPEQLYERYPLRVTADRDVGLGNVLEQSPMELAGQLEAKYPGLKLGLTGRAGKPWSISRIVVPEGERSAGIGTQVMGEILAAADAQGATVTLTPSSDFGGNKKRLTEFYKRFGFVENKGRNKDYEISDAMYRPAQVLKQEIPQGARGFFNPEQNIIALLKKADLSTFLHESGHFFLETQLGIARQIAQGGVESVPGGQQVIDDVNALMKWFKVDSLDAWFAMDFEQRRDHHEQFARGFEAYLFEGKAPSIELQGLFQRFRSWLMSIYRELKRLNVELTDEVRGVMDRMIATNDQIQLAEQARSMMPLFETAEQAGMTVEEFAAYQALGTEATADAIDELQARGMRDMQWMHNARGREVKRLQKEAGAKRAEVRKQVAEEVMREPVYRAWEALTSKDGPKLDAAQVRELGLPELLSFRLRDYKMVRVEGGIHPDVAAEMFGFSSGDEMVRALGAAEKPSNAIEAATDARMLEQFGELATPDAISRAADRAIHNDVRARMIATEANALAKATGRPRILAKAAKDFASAMIARLKIRDIRPNQYANAEARAAKAAEKASRSGDVATAAAEKRNQLVQNYATKAAYNAQDEIDKGVRYLKKFDSEGSRKSLSAEYIDQIDTLLERFDLRTGQSLSEIDKRKSLLDWVNAQREQGMEPDVPPELLNEALRKSYKDMSVEEFRGLVDTVKQIEHLGRLKKKLLTAKDQREYDVIVQSITDSIDENANGRRADTRTPTTNLGRAIEGLRKFYTSHIKAAAWARIMDGGKDGGQVWEYLIRSANERADQEATARANATLKLSEILAPVMKQGKMGGKGQFFPSINRSLNREARIAIALNVGNEGNLQRLLGGEGWTLDRLMPVLESLTADEWQAVQSVWDHFESYRPQIAAKETRIYGKEPDWVDPGSQALAAISAQLGVDLKGGYYPIKYDPKASQRAEEHSDAEEAKRQMQGAYTSATTRRSFTKSRSEEVVGRPLLYTLAGMYQGVNDVIHDIAWHEWLIDANRLMRSNRIDTAIRTQYGPEVKQQFKSWIQDIAGGDGKANAALDPALQYLRQSVSVAGLGFNVVSAAMQPLGLTQSIVRVGAPWIARGVAEYVVDPRGASRKVNGMSAFMRNRGRTRFRELNELRNQVQDQTAVKSFVQNNAYRLMMAFQSTVDVPTWLGAYSKAIADGNEDDRAVQLADQAVIDSQGGGETKDLSAIERGGSAQKLFTVFYTFMNTALNIGVVQGMTERNKVKLAVNMLLLYTVPAVLGQALKDAIVPGGDEDDDWLDFAKGAVGAQIDYLFGLFVIAREFAGAAKIVTGTTDFGAQGYPGPAGVRMIGDVYKLGAQAAQGEADLAFVKSFINVAGDMLGLPSAQINRTITGTAALSEGDTDNPAAVVFGYQR